MGSKPQATAPPPRRGGPATPSPPPSAAPPALDARLEATAEVLAQLAEAPVRVSLGGGAPAAGPAPVQQPTPAAAADAPPAAPRRAGLSAEAAAAALQGLKRPSGDAGGAKGAARPARPSVAASSPGGALSPGAEPPRAAAAPLGAPNRVKRHLERGPKAIAMDVKPPVEGSGDLQAAARYRVAAGAARSPRAALGPVRAWRPGRMRQPAPEDGAGEDSAAAGGAEAGAQAQPAAGRAPGDAGGGSSAALASEQGDTSAERLAAEAPSRAVVMAQGGPGRPSASAASAGVRPAARVAQPFARHASACPRRWTTSAVTAGVSRGVVSSRAVACAAAPEGSPSGGSSSSSSSSPSSLLMPAAPPVYEQLRGSLEVPGARHVQSLDLDLEELFASGHAFSAGRKPDSTVEAKPAEWTQPARASVAGRGGSSRAKPQERPRKDAGPTEPRAQDGLQRLRTTLRRGVLVNVSLTAESTSPNGDCAYHFSAPTLAGCAAGWRRE